MQLRNNVAEAIKSSLLTEKKAKNYHSSVIRDVVGDTIELAFSLFQSDVT